MLTALQLKLLGGAVLLLALAGIALSIYNKGKAAGYVEGQRAQLEIDRKQFEQDRAQFLEQLRKYEEKDEAAKAQIVQRDIEIAELRQRRTANRVVIDRLPDAAIVGDIQQRLGSPPSSTLSDAQLRRLDEVLADYQNLQQQVAALEAKSAEQDKRIDAIEHQRDAAIASYNKLVPMYAKAYNAAQGKRFFLWRIPPFRWIVPQRKLDLPDPVTLERP